jgi:hypothetical protein
MAAETINLETVTSVEITGSAIKIKTSYSRILPSLIETQITESVGIMDGVSFIEGELLVKYKNNNVLVYLNDLGELILVGTEEVNDYFINSNGDLVYQE